MGIEQVVNEFIKREIGGIIVTGESGNILYSDSNMKLSPHTLKRFLNRLPRLDKDGDRKKWELTESDGGKYYSITSAAKLYDGGLCRVHCISDVSELADLSKGISEYSRGLSDLSDFQTKIMGMISMSYDSFLPALAELCGTEEAVIRTEFLWSRRIAVTLYSNGKVTKTSYPLNGNTDFDELFALERFETFGGYRCLMCEPVAERRCAVLLRDSDRFSEQYFRDISVYNTIRLFVENGILREKIIFEGEHDQLTGFFNSSKFAKNAADSFGDPDSLAVYIVSVGDLEYMNDHYGNAAGDMMIKRAADSIRPFLTDNIQGYRTGGDKFAVIACGLDQDSAAELILKWKEQLEALNTEDDRYICNISCGMAFGSGEYDTDKLLEQADVSMYREKRRLKEELIKRASAI